MVFVFLSILVAVFGIVNCIIVNINLIKIREDAARKTVVLNRSAWIMGLVVGCPFSVLAIVFGIKGPELEDVFALGSCVCFIWFSNWLMYSWLNNIIVYDKDGFWKSYIPGIRKYYIYTDLSGYQRNDSKVVLYLENGERRLSFKYKAVSFEDFMSFVFVVYRLRTGQDLPIQSVEQNRDLFYGNIKDPGEMIAISVILLLGGFLCTVFCLFAGYDYENAGNTEYFETTLTYTGYDNSDLFFLVAGYKQDFELDYYYKYDKTLIAELLDAVNSGERFQLYAKYYSGFKGSRSKYVIYNLEDTEGKTYITFEQVNRMSKDIWLMVAAFCFLYFVLCLVFVIFMIRVGRHPERYSKKIRSIFFKESAFVRKIE